LTSPGDCVILSRNLSFGPDNILRFHYSKEGRAYHKNIVRVDLDGRIWIRHPSTKDEVLVGRGFALAGLLILAIPVQ